jgi:protein O-mannosyl-transferase
MTDVKTAPEKTSAPGSAGAWPALIVSLILIAMVAFTYRDVLHHKFVYDDFELVVKNAGIRDLNFRGAATMMFNKRSLNYLPMRMLSYAVDYHFWKLNPAGYHITNIVLHAADCLLVFYLVLYLLTRVAVVPWGMARAVAAAGVSAAFFAVHPIHVEAVTWVSGRKDVLYSFFFLVGSIAFIRYRVKGEPTRFRGGYIVSLLCLGAAMMSKGTAISYPFVLLLFDLLFPVIARRTSLSQRVQEHFFMFLGLAIFFALDMRLAAREGMISSPFGGGVASHIFTVVKIVPFYLGLIFLPIHLSAVYDVASSHSIAEPAVILSVLAMAVLIGVFIYCRRREPLVSFSIGWFLLLLGPTLNIVPFGTFAADRYAYLALLGVCLVAGLVFDRVARIGRAANAAAWVVLICSLVACCQISHVRNADWKDQITFWSATKKTTPRSAKVRVGLGLAYIMYKQYDKALAELETAKKLDPEYVDDYIGLALYYLTVREPKKALGVLEEGLKYDPYNIELHYYVAMSYYDLGKYKSSATIFATVVRADPFYKKSRHYLYMSLKRLSKTMPYEQYQRFRDNM